MTLVVEFFGIPRQRAGCARCELQFDGPHATLRQALTRLADLFPGLQGECVDKGRLSPGYTANLAGNQFITNPDFRLVDGAELLILSADAGG
jgi:hypothetical protein